MRAVRRRTTAVLVASQILGGLGVATGIALAAVLAEEVSGSEGLAGLASTASVIGTALLSLPLASLMAAKGRRPGLTLAYLIAAVGGATVVLGATADSFPLMLCGMAAFGAGSSANLQARFAAADLAEPHHRARAISTVVWATTIGAVLGPNIAGPAGESVAALGTGIPVAAGPFLWGSAIFLVSALTVHLLLRPDPLLTARDLASSAAAQGEGGSSGGRRADERSLRAGLAAVAASARARLALVTIAGVHTVMVSIMVMTPVDLGHHGAGIELIGLVISIHIAGMYAFSPLMGWLADRLGRVAVIGLSVGLLACAAALAGTAGADHLQSAAGLFVLGLGWSAGLVSGSALLTDAVPQGARAAVQGLSDLTSNAAAGAGGALSGLVVAQAGYGWLTALAAALLLPVGATALAVALRRTRTPASGA
ncbi:MFS transporter [Streptomyces sp. DSM 42041]|uniref:MFS transporter n=1 Tax=Streptomyces hazeniae TaxID=3075538 RepID=A0ABU2NTU2_9ACTN|nr:MFS transporter [Streptomyces sp. DSM 42041]MDT0379912.1 MFS transporter [Streptomyces sp. DSM 42041]